MGRALSIGMMGDDVRLLQQLLNHHLSPPLDKIDEDGVFGGQTQARVIEFQTRNQNYPTQMPLPQGLPAEYYWPLNPDGIVGSLTANVLFDARTLRTIAPAEFTPMFDDGAVSSGGPSGAMAFGDPVGDPQPQPQPPRTFRLVQLSMGSQVTANPWSASPFVLTGQYVLLAKNDGRPDFLLTAGGQASFNDGGANGRWSAQGFVQMGLGGFDNLKLFGDKLDWFNPFVAAMLNVNFKNNFGLSGNPGVGLAIGNQVTWSLLSKPLPGGGGMQDTLSLFFNAQAVTITDLGNGQNSAPSGQFLLGAIKTFF